jgi:hypothetical protein
MQFDLGRRIGIRALVVGFLTAVSPVSTHAQNASLQPPEEVVLAYRTMDRAGERLSADGWYRASKYFVKPAPPPEKYSITVVMDEVFNSVRISGDKAEVLIRGAAVGQIDPSGRFTFVVHPPLTDLSGNLVKQPVSPDVTGPAFTTWGYELVLSDAYWEFVPGRRDIRQVTGRREWRMEYFEHQPMVTVGIAIRYLNKLRDKPVGPTVQRNVDKSVAVLRRYLSRR